MYKLRNALLILPILYGLSACATGSTVPVPTADSYCRIAKPISYDSTVDSAATVGEIEAHNSAWVCVCEHDCPK